MSVLTRKPREEKPPQQKQTAHQRLAEIDTRIREARTEANALSREQELAAQAAVNADQELIRAQGRHGAKQISDDEVAQIEKSYDAAKQVSDRPWGREVAVAQAKVAALEEERAGFVSQNSAQLADEVMRRAQGLRERIVHNPQERGEISAEITAVQQAWKAIGYTASRFPLDTLQQEWRREARVFDPGSVPLIVPEPR